MDWERTAYKSKSEKYVMTGFYIFVFLLFPSYIYRTLGIMINDVYSARLLGLLGAAVLLLVFFVSEESLFTKLQEKW